MSEKKRRAVFVYVPYGILSEDTIKKLISRAKSTKRTKWYRRILIEDVGMFYIEKRRTMTEKTEKERRKMKEKMFRGFKSLAGEEDEIVQLNLKNEDELWDLFK
jgi:hypothetical protein